MAERSNAAVLKTVDPKGPGVRIPLSPHFPDNQDKTHLDAHSCSGDFLMRYLKALSLIQDLNLSDILSITCSAFNKKNRRKNSPVYTLPKQTSTDFAKNL